MPRPPAPPPPAAEDVPIEDLLRTLAPRVLGATVRRFGDFDGSEDAVQEALLAAATQWPAQGVPENPGGWLYTVAGRRMTDRIRSDAARRQREERQEREATRAAARSAAEPAAQPAPIGDGDDSLLLLFLCCHPSLPPGSAIPLTLRAVGGLTTAEIAKAFLVPEATMAQRISRAKQRIRDAGARFTRPGADEIDERLRSVLHVLYLLFNEGYTSTAGEQLARPELSAEAIRLARALHAQLPDHAEAAGLLALMVLTDARRPARTGPTGELIPLAEQDRTLWDRAAIAEGITLVSAAIERGAVGEYQLQALIAGTHDQAARAEDTDWAHIDALYGLLERMTGNPMVTLNRAIARAMVEGPQAGLAMLEPLDAALGAHHRLAAVRAHLHDQAGDTGAAVAAFRVAADRTTSIPERRYLLSQAARLEAIVATTEDDGDAARDPEDPGA